MLKEQMKQRETVRGESACGIGRLMGIHYRCGTADVSAMLWCVCGEALSGLAENRRILYMSFKTWKLIASAEID